MSRDGKSLKVLTQAGFGREDTEVGHSLVTATNVTLWAEWVAPGERPALPSLCLHATCRHMAF